jgi:hypothetical protein
MFGIVTVQSIHRVGYGVDYRGVMAQFLVGTETYTFSSIQTKYAVHPASQPMNTGALIILG